MNDAHVGPSALNTHDPVPLRQCTIYPSQPPYARRSTGQIITYEQRQSLAISSSWNHPRLEFLRPLVSTKTRQACEMACNEWRLAWTCQQHCDSENEKGIRLETFWHYVAAKYWVAPCDWLCVVKDLTHTTRRKPRARLGLQAYANRASVNKFAIQLTLHVSWTPLVWEARESDPDERHQANLHPFHSKNGTVSCQCNG
jgi:hypothetical protein